MICCITASQCVLIPGLRATRIYVRSIDSPRFKLKFHSLNWSSNKISQD